MSAHGQTHAASEAVSRILVGCGVAIATPDHAPFTPVVVSARTCTEYASPTVNPVSTREREVVVTSVQESLPFLYRSR